jgi:hypothetical protein
MNASAPTRVGVRLRPIALPVEHGGWSMLGAPIVLGLLVAPSAAGFWLSLAALGAFLTRQPLKLALGDRRRGKRFPRTVWAERFALLYGAIALGAFAAAWFTTAHPFWLPLLLAAPLAALQLSYDMRKQSRAPLAEYSGAAAISAVTAAIAMADGWAAGPALLLWLLLAIQSIPAIIYVATRLRLARSEAARREPALAAHLLALCVVSGLAWAGLIPWPLGGVFTLLLLRAGVGMLPRSLHTPTPLVGMQELGWSLLTVIVIALG